jgi:hypothetical protein
MDGSVSLSAILYNITSHISILLRVKYVCIMEFCFVGLPRYHLAISFLTDTNVKDAFACVCNPLYS